MSKDFQQHEWDALVEDQCRRIIRSAVLEDLDRGQDWTTLALASPEAIGRAAIVARTPGVIAGLPAIDVIIDEMDRRLHCQFQAHDGAAMAPAAILAQIEGPARALLTAERLMLNFVGRLSGIATLTRKFVDAVAGTQARIYDTRKTTPGWRRLEKYAVRAGGGHNHRTGLFDAILIKDNHLVLGADTAGRKFTPPQAVRLARQFVAENFPPDDPRRQMIVEVEVDSLSILEEVLSEGPDLVLLDNLSVHELQAAVTIRNRLAPSVELEASGGVSLATVGQIAATGVERISSGALTHSAAWLDVAIDWAG